MNREGAEHPRTLTTAAHLGDSLARCDIVAALSSYVVMALYRHGPRVMALYVYGVHSSGLYGYSMYSYGPM